MRWIILTLLVANLAVGGWTYWQSTLPGEPAPSGSAAEMNNLTLDEETRERLRALDRQAASEPAPEPAPEPEPVMCVRITGIPSADEANVIESRLSALEVPTRRETREEVVRSDYWVVLGPFDSQTLARERLSEIQARDIESFLIGQGRLEGGISLGLFSSRSNAQTRVSQLNEQDIEARIEEVNRTRETLMLIIDQEAAERISDSGLESIVDEFEDVGFQRYAC